MASTFTTNLKFNKPALGDAGWGTAVNGGFTDLADVAISGVETVDVTAGNVTMTIDSGASGTNDARNMFIEVDGTMPANRVVTVPANSKLYFVFNNTSGTYTLDFENAGGGVEVPQGKRVPLYSDGTEVRYAFDHLGALTLDTALAATSGGTGQSSYAVGDLLYADTTTTLDKLASVAAGNVLRAGGVGAAPAWGQVGLTTDVTGVLPVANGGTGVATLAANNVLLGNGTSAVQEVAPGADGNVLTASSGTWVSAALPAVTGLGYGQTWQSVSRSSGVTYTNSTGKPIVVAFTVNTSSGANQGDFQVDGVIIYSWNNGATNFQSRLQIIIPVGATYIYNNVSNSPFANWVELR